MDETKNNLVVALSLALIVLTSWEEDDRRNPGKMIRRAWKGFLLEALDNLEQRGFIRHSGASRSLQVTDAGKKIGQELGVHFRDALGAFIASPGWPK